MIGRLARAVENFSIFSITVWRDLRNQYFFHPRRWVWRSRLAFEKGEGWRISASIWQSYQIDLELHKLVFRTAYRGTLAKPSRPLPAPSSTQPPVMFRLCWALMTSKNHFKYWSKLGRVEMTYLIFLRYQKKKKIILTFHIHQKSTICVNCMQCEVVTNSSEGKWPRKFTHISRKPLNEMLWGNAS